MKGYISLLILVSFLPQISETSVRAQEISQITLCKEKYDFVSENDSIHMYFSLSDFSGERIIGISDEELNNNLRISANNASIRTGQLTFNRFNTKKTIPADYTFSIIIDQTLPLPIRQQISEDVTDLINHSAPKSIFISFLGQSISPSIPAEEIASENFTYEFPVSSRSKRLYSAIMAKSKEFCPENGSLLSETNDQTDDLISSRASEDNGKNILLIFLDGDNRPDDDEPVTFLDVCRFRQDYSGKVSLPVLNFFYYSRNNNYPGLTNTFKGLTKPIEKDGHILNSGTYLPLECFRNAIEDYLQTEYESIYDYSVSFSTDKIHRGRKTDFIFTWKDRTIGTYSCHMGLPEKPWPETSGKINYTIKYLSSFVLTILFIILIYAFHEIGTPLSGSILFSLKYYRRYIPDAAVRKRVCPYCRMPILEHQSVVVRCRHIMHLHCWKENNYRCVEYGQNCTEGIQPRINWSGLFAIRTLKKHINVIIGITTGFMGWIIYDLTGGTLFMNLSSGIVKMISPCITQENNFINPEYATFISSVMTIALLIGFLSSITFRLFENTGGKNKPGMLQIMLRAILTAIVGVLCFLISAIISYILLSDAGINYIPWYCSLSCYIIFTSAIVFCMGIKSDISIGKRFIGGIFSSTIGYLVLYYAEPSYLVNNHIPILLFFIIVLGGLGMIFIAGRIPPVRFSLMIRNGLRRGQIIPIHKWLNNTGPVCFITIGMSAECEIRMNWEKNGEIAKQHAIISLNPEDRLPEIKPLADGIFYNDTRYLNINETITISDGDEFKIGNTLFRYCENH